MSGQENDEWDQKILQGEIIPENSYDYQIWTEYYQEFKDLVQQLVFRKWGFVPSQFNLFKIFTSIFLHGSLLHLLGNMLFLWLAGANLEGDLGEKVYTIFYFASGYAASFFHYLVNTGSDVPCVGASGAIAGLMGAFMIRFYLTKIKFFYFIWLIRPLWGNLRVPAYVCLPLWFIDQLLSAKSGDIGIAFWAHIGGFVVGACMIVIMQAAEMLPPMDPKGDEDEDFYNASQKIVQELRDKEQVISHATIRDLPALLAIVRVEPENTEALLALARIQYQSGAQDDSAVSYNTVLTHMLAAQKNEQVSLIYGEIKNRSLFKMLTRENILRLIPFFENLKEYKDAVRLAVLYIMKFPDDPSRPKMIYKAYLIYKDHLHDTLRASKAAMLLKKEYPHLIKPSVTTK
ncbi:rhomboid family intramembrane serine protease [bacterium]|nr:rhomboid family intramembrane serine protease [bacterium]